MSRDVTLVGPYTDASTGKRYVKGQTVSMSDTDADWYTKAVLEQRNAALSQPMVAAVASIARPAAPADPTAHPDVSTVVNSTDRDNWQNDGINRHVVEGSEAGNDAGQDNSDPDAAGTDAQRSTVKGVTDLNRDNATAETMDFNTRATP